MRSATNLEEAMACSHLFRRTQGSVFTASEWFHLCLTASWKTQIAWVHSISSGSENFWSMLARRLAHHQTPVTTLEKVRHRVETAWTSVLAPSMQHLFLTQRPDVSKAVILRLSSEAVIF
ncbi:hypothetical protein TNCV_2981091 [Trichonephila clavipes]|nr:hypothetical protein TNCV_2981091 [Trichonephila clavipes]